ncbi:hypothetical protein [Pseudonocardia sp. KRD291]|nr:hypothetical protein [Pseudonocardia sp. KRD291]MBW0101628.1 hypothetical protein [Pseudonocardia sp. KRD291]
MAGPALPEAARLNSEGQLGKFPDVRFKIVANENANAYVPLWLASIDRC